MALSYLIKINNTDITNLVEYKVSDNKLWKDAGRTMSGKLKATLVGIFPKISLSFTYLTASEIATITTLLKNAQFTVNYWDFKSQTYKEGEYYASDYEISIYDKEKEIYKPFSVNLIPYDKQI